MPAARLKYLVLVSTFCFLLFPCELFSRAGGASSSGGGGGGGGGSFGGGYYHHGYYGYGGYHEKFDPVVTTIVLICTAVFFGIAVFGVTWLILIHNQNARRELKKAAGKDEFWNEEQMLAHARDTYIKVQEAWSKNDLSAVLPLVTRDFFIHYQHFLLRYTKMNLKNVMKDVVIGKAQIVKIIDKDYDNEDTFLVHIKGKMIDYLVNTQTGIILDGDKDIACGFEDIYVFFRRENKWLLNQIINDPDSKYMRLVKENKG